MTGDAIERGRRPAIVAVVPKHTSIAVVREYDRTLPRLHAFGSELNPVWTNLLDNAIDDGPGIDPQGCSPCGCS